MDTTTTVAPTSADEAPQPLGVFRAVTTRDHVALQRDGVPYYDIDYIREQPDGPLYEIRFADGDWMLASIHDLHLAPEPPRPDTENGSPKPEPAPHTATTQTKGSYVP
jgi:hypothetical protein